MSPEKAGKYSAEKPPSSKSQWPRKILVGAGLLAVGIGSWTANQYSIGWTGKSFLDYVKSTSSEKTTKPCRSTLTEPWSKVSYCLPSFHDHIHILQARAVKHFYIVNQFGIAAAELPMRLPLKKNLNTTIASVTSNAPDSIFLWTGTAPNLAILALGLL